MLAGGVQDQPFRLVLLGPPGSGKTVQGQKLRDDLGWVWLSMGELLRQTGDPGLQKVMGTGELVDVTLTNKMMAEAIQVAAADGKNTVIDGYPRETRQAENLAELGLLPNLVVILNVPEPEILRRLEARGRADDIDEKAVRRRIEVFFGGIGAIRAILERQRVAVREVEGDDTIEAVHKTIMRLVV